ncbi:hypothetical protein CTTA_3186 [Comamonas testosteroni]|uniref:Uncharacterized protein n=2 Tax=Comamonas testosteroni TaxID=285 RepID=A0A5A7MGW2_COMTE|nr:hypothetical protein CTTA_3186 [Comamonas testosteroni]
MSGAGLAVAEGAGILAEQATLLMANIAMPAWRSHGGIREQGEESGAEKAEDMREKAEGDEKSARSSGAGASLAVLDNDRLLLE